MHEYISLDKSIKQNKKDRQLFYNCTEQDHKSLFSAQVTSCKLFEYVTNRMDALD